VPRRYPLKGWVIGILSGAVTLAALIIGSVYGDVHAKTLNPKLVAWISTIVIIGAGIVATARLSTAFSHLMARRNVPAFEGAVKFISAAVGYLFVAFSALAVLNVSVERLLVGAGVAGIVLGIAAQQSLGNIFAGLVLILARPFVVGDHIRIRSGALGGIFDAWVLEMSLTYVTVRTDDGQLKIPNTAMLAAGVGKLPPEGLPPQPAQATPATSTPATSTPATSTPATSTLATSTPATSTPARPTTAQPSTAQPSTAQPTTAQPTTAQPTTAQPAGQSVAAQPALISNDGGQSASAQSIVDQSAGSRAGEAQAGEAEAGEAQAGEAEAGEAQAGEAEAGEAWAGEAQAGEAQAGNGLSGEAHNRTTIEPVPPTSASGSDGQ
jgi:Mechanosensitive ion channel, beta-domain